MSCSSLYIHIPFCERKCPYCDFYSVPADSERMDVYLAATLRTLETQPHPLAPLETIYFGGGTPSLFGGARLAQILEAVERRFSITSDAEITVECNPHSTLAVELALMKQAGVNRLSFGMQSADDAQLRVLGRTHTLSGLEAAVNAAVACGFSHYSLDMMLATPGQTLADINRAAACCAALGAEHVSAYLLKVEPGTPFDWENIAARCPDEDGQAAFYLHAVEVLSRLGYAQYEISNFARDGLIARHNTRYWDCAEYLGIGPAAHSFVEGRRFYIPRDLDGFLAADRPFSLVVDDGLGGDVGEYLMLRLRLNEGVRWEQLAVRYPEFDSTFLRENARRIPDGLLCCDDHCLHLTPDGFLVSNTIIATLLN